MTHVRPRLPISAPIREGLKVMRDFGLTARSPSSALVDWDAFEPAELYQDNDILEEVGRAGGVADLLELHSGLFLLGTEDRLSSRWITQV